MLKPVLFFQVYGLNFSSKDDADVFATAMLKALEVIFSLFYDVWCVVNYYSENTLVNFRVFGMKWIAITITTL